MTLDDVLDKIETIIDSVKDKIASEPVTEGKNKFRYDYQGWQQVYQAYYSSTGKQPDVFDCW
jgi:hypothetical protein